MSYKLFVAIVYSQRVHGFSSPHWSFMLGHMCWTYSGGHFGWHTGSCSESSQSCEDQLWGTAACDCHHSGLYLCAHIHTIDLKG